MLSSIQGGLKEIAQTVCLYHHEWHDSSKSYWGKRSCDLPAYVPIVSICDVFTALVVKRPYKEPWPPERALGYIQKQAGTQFDPALVDVFIPLVRNDRRIPDIFMGGGIKH